MKRSTFGVLVAGAMTGLLGTAVVAHHASAADEKACYRKHCGKSIQGYEGQCGGTRVEGIADEKKCDSVGGAWTTETDAAQYKKKHD